MTVTGRVLILGVYLTDRENTAHHLAYEFAQSRRWHVEQSWLALGKGEIETAMRKYTVDRQTSPASKFILINRLLGLVDPEAFEFVFVCDDDIYLPDRFVDDYLYHVIAHDFALAQPARTPDSFIDHVFVRRLGGIAARQTRFVEIGPLFSMRRDTIRWLTPFNEESPMGWGYDFAWPCLAAAHDFKLGIVDCMAVAHTLRKPVSHYSYADADRQRRTYLQTVPHLSRMEAFTIIESFPE